MERTLKAEELKVRVLRFLCFDGAFSFRLLSSHEENVLLCLQRVYPPQLQLKLEHVQLECVEGLKAGNHTVDYPPEIKILLLVLLK